MADTLQLALAIPWQQGQTIKRGFAVVPSPLSPSDAIIRLLASVTQAH